jgi:hypothetical protein
MIVYKENPVLSIFYFHRPSQGHRIFSTQIFMEYQDLEHLDLNWSQRRPKLSPWSDLIPWPHHGVQLPPLEAPMMLIFMPLTCLDLKMSIYTAPILIVEYGAPWRQKTQNKGDPVKIGGKHRRTPRTTPSSP